MTLTELLEEVVQRTNNEHLECDGCKHRGTCDYADCDATAAYLQSHGFLRLVPGPNGYMDAHYEVASHDTD